MKLRSSISICIAFLICLTGCNRKPKGVVDEGKMVDILADIQLAEAYYSNAGPSGISRNALIESVLDKYGVTTEELDSTIAYYGRNMDEYYLLYEKVEKKLRNQTASENTEIKENDIWPYPSFTVFFPGQISEDMAFSIPADALERGDAVEWKMRLTSPDGIEAMLGVEYDNGMISSFSKNAAGNRSLEVKLQTDTSLVAKRIFGFVSVPESSRPLWADSIRLVKLDYDSLEYYKIRNQKRIFKPATKPKPVSVENMEGTVITDTVNR